MPQVAVNAQVHARARSTGRVFTADTDNDGDFEFRALPAGTYDVEVQVKGASRRVQWPGVIVCSNTRAWLDIVLDDRPLTRRQRGVPRYQIVSP